MKRNKTQISQRLKQVRLLPVFALHDFERAVRTVTALSAAGQWVLAFRLPRSGDGSIFPALRAYCRDHLPEMVLGAAGAAGPDQAAGGIEAGADFIAGGSWDEPTARVCNHSRVIYFPVCRSEDQARAAGELGLDFLQVPVEDTPLKAAPGFWTLLSARWPAPYEALTTGLRKGVGGAILDLPVLEDLDETEGALDALCDGLQDVDAALRQAWASRLEPHDLFLGIEHVGLYPYQSAGAKAIAGWYCRMFGFGLDEVPSSYLVEGRGPGRIEALKEGTTDRCHIAVQVADLDQGIAALHDQGIETGGIVRLPHIGWAYLKTPDPAGNPVHLVWRR